MKKAIVNGKVILKDTVQETNVLIEDDRIVGLSDSVPDGYEIIDAKGLYVSPGFVDIHTHGRNLCDTMNGTPESIDTISVNCLKTGVTSFLPTTMTQSIDQTHQAIVNCAKYMGHENGAKVAGVHMEGPFIDQAHKGAQLVNTCWHLRSRLTRKWLVTREGDSSDHHCTEQLVQRS